MLCDMLLQLCKLGIINEILDLSPEIRLLELQNGLLARFGSLPAPQTLSRRLRIAAAQPSPHAPAPYAMREPMSMSSNSLEML